MKMAINKILFLFLTVAMVTTAYDEYVHPHYTYSCEEDRSIIVRGISDGSYVTILNPNSSTCTDYKLTSKSQQVHITAGCLTKNILNNSSSVEISIWDYVYDGTTTTTTATSTTSTVKITGNSQTNNTTLVPSPATPSAYPTPPLPSPPPPPSNIKGGHRLHYFNLTCKEISLNGVDRIAENQMHLQDSEVKKDSTFEVAKVKMTFRKKSDITSEQLTRIYTGDEFYMFLEYVGTSANHYVVMPKTCTAIPGNNVGLLRMEGLSSNETLELWKYNTCVTDKAQALALMENFKFMGSYARVKMYGFHFEGVSDISIVCNVTVCRSKTDTGCKPHYGDRCPAATGRRKRRTGKFNKTLYVHLKQLFFTDHENLMQHKNARDKIVREKRSAQKESTKDTMVYNTIRVFDTDFDVSGASFSTSLPIMTYFVCFLLRRFF